MEILKQKILAEGIVLFDQVLKVDSFLNHQVDPVLMRQIGKEFAARFANEQVTRILTIETSGICPALMTALEMGVPLVYARKQQSVIMNEEAYTARVFSFTKQKEYEISVARKFIGPNDRILLIDDFLAHGEAALGLANIVRQAGARLAGIGIVIEKTFQSGGQKLREAGYRVESLVKLSSLENHAVQFAEQETMA